MQSSHDVVVIGGGHNGLIAACYVARAGLDVLVVEAAATVGGMTTTTNAIPEAPDHLIDLCAAESILLRATTVVKDLQLARYGYQELELDPSLLYMHPEGSSVAIWRDPRRTADEIRKFSTKDADAYLELARTLDAVLDFALPLMRSNPRRLAPRTIAKLAVSAARRRRDLKGASLLVTSSLAQAVQETFRHPMSRDAIATIVEGFGPLGGDGGASSLFSLGLYHRVGPGRQKGGTQGLPNALVEALRTAGGKVRCGAVVEEILVSDGRAIGIRLAGGEEITARQAVLSTCDPRATLGTYLPRGTLSDALETRVEHIPSQATMFPGFRIGMAFSGRLRLDRHEKWRGDGLDLRKPFAMVGTMQDGLDGEAAAAAGQLPNNVNIVAGIPTALDPSLAPAGQDTLYLFAYPMPARPVESWETLGAEAVKSILVRAADFYEGLGELEIGRWTETPDQLKERMRAPGGWMHVEMSLLRLGPLRPALGLSGYRTPVPGLYLGGAGSHPGAGISGMPGQLSAQEILRTVQGSELKQRLRLHRPS